MNRYGAQVMRHWQEEHPQAYQELTAELADPEQFFTERGEEIAQQIEERARELAGAQPEGENYLQRLQRLNTARFEAESEIMREVLLAETPLET